MKEDFKNIEEAVGFLNGYMIGVRNSLYMDLKGNKNIAKMLMDDMKKAVDGFIDQELRRIRNESYEDIEVLPSSEEKNGRA